MDGIAPHRTAPHAPAHGPPWFISRAVSASRLAVVTVVDDGGARGRARAGVLQQAGHGIAKEVPLSDLADGSAAACGQ